MTEVAEPRQRIESGSPPRKFAWRIKARLRPGRPDWNSRSAARSVRGMRTTIDSLRVRPCRPYVYVKPGSLLLFSCLFETKLRAARSLRPQAHPQDLDGPAVNHRYFGASGTTSGAHSASTKSPCPEEARSAVSKGGQRARCSFWLQAGDRKPSRHSRRCSIRESPHPCKSSATGRGRVSGAVAGRRSSHPRANEPVPQHGCLL